MVHRATAQSPWLGTHTGKSFERCRVCFTNVSRALEFFRDRSLAMRRNSRKQRSQTVGQKWLAEKKLFMTKKKTKNSNQYLRIRNHENTVIINQLKIHYTAWAFSDFRGSNKQARLRQTWSHNGKSLNVSVCACVARVRVCVSSRHEVVPRVYLEHVERVVCHARDIENTRRGRTVCARTENGKKTIIISTMVAYETRARSLIWKRK